jgi:hypothetical protein
VDPEVVRIRSALLSRGVPITDVARWMGHKDIRETYMTYSHFMPEAEDRGVAVLDAEYAEWSRTLCRNSMALRATLGASTAQRPRAKIPGTLSRLKVSGRSMPQ